MHWKMKARIQHAISMLPASASYGAYYWVQRRFGSLKRWNPVCKLVAGIETCRRLEAHGSSPRGKVFFEVGTGRVPLAPLAFWLLGAERTVTIDLNPYLKEELIVDSLRFMAERRDEMASLFGPSLDHARLDEVLKFGRQPQPSMDEFFEMCGIQYIAPGDAADSGLPPNSVDVHTSYTVFEHIPPDVLRAILVEGNRITRDDGLFVHKIDFSDHFSHTDRRICAVNFLQFSDRQWERFAGNRFMYMNRLRHADYVQLFESVGQEVISTEPNTDVRSLESLRTGRVQVDHRFRTRSEEELAITWSWMTTRKLPVAVQS